MAKKLVIDSLIDVISRYAVKTAFWRGQLRRIEMSGRDRRSTERGKTRSARLRPGRLTFAILCVAACVWFVVARIGSYNNFPPEDLYTNPAVLNLTDRGIEWDVFYGQSPDCASGPCHLDPDYPADRFTRRMVLPAREFPLIGYSTGQLIYLRTTLTLPPNLINSPEPIAFHSFWIWAKSYEFYVNGVLLDEGGQELLNITIPHNLVPPSGEIRLAFRIDPSGLPYQGLAHRGDLLIGPKSLVLPTQFAGEEEGTTRFLWFLLPKITFCITFCFLFLVFSQNSEFLMFIAYAFLSSLQTFLQSDYSGKMLPFDWDWFSLSLIPQTYSLLFFMMFIKEFYRLKSPRLDRVFAGALIATTIGFMAVPEVLSKNIAFNIGTLVNSALSIGSALFGVYWSLSAMIFLHNERADAIRARIAAFLFMFFLISLVPFGVQAINLAADMLGTARQNETHYLDMQVEMLFFLVMSGITAIEFGMTHAAKERVSAELQAIEARLELARSVQHLLMPGEIKGQDDAVEYQFFYESAEQMSGDWLQVWQTPDGEQRFIIGDVVGKGAQAALAVSAIAGILNECKHMGVSLEHTVRKINSLLIDLFKHKITSTLSAASIAPDGSVTLLNCGGVGWFTAQGAKLQHFPLPGSPLGVKGELAIGQMTIAERDERTFFSCTDGVLEGSRAVKTLMRSLKAQPIETHAPLAAINDLIIASGKAFVLSDDKTVVVFRRRLEQETGSIDPRSA